MRCGRDGPNLRPDAAQLRVDVNFNLALTGRKADLILMSNPPWWCDGGKFAAGGAAQGWRHGRAQAQERPAQESKGASGAGVAHMRVAPPGRAAAETAL